MDINESYYVNQYLADQTDQNRALMKGAFVLGQPLLNPEEERGQKSLKLYTEIKRMHEEYKAGHILPNMTSEPESSFSEHLFEKLESYGVEFVPEEPGKKNPRAYQELCKKRAKRK